MQPIHLLWSNALDFPRPRIGHRVDKISSSGKPHAVHVSARVIKSHGVDWVGCIRLQPGDGGGGVVYFWMAGQPHPIHHITPFFKAFSSHLSKFPITSPQGTGMSGHPTLSPTCSLDIRLFTPATSPISEPKTADTAQEAGGRPRSLREQYQPRGSEEDDYTDPEDGGLQRNSTREPLAMTKRPKLALNIHLATSTSRDLDAGDTTTPPLSPESVSSGSPNREEARQAHLKRTLHALTGIAHRPKLALNIPTLPWRASGPTDTGETTTPPLSPQYHPETAQHLSPHDEGDFKFTRRSLNSETRRKPTLINLPPYIQALVIHYVAKNEWLDKYSLRVTCRRFYSLVEPPRPGFSIQWPSYQKCSLLSCRDCLRLRNRTEFIDYFRFDAYRPGGTAARERYCIDCGLKEQFLAGRRIPPRLKKRTRLKVDGIDFVVCVYCGEFGQAPDRAETWVMDCCCRCFNGNKPTPPLMSVIPASTPSLLRRDGGFGKVLDGSPVVVGGG